MRKKIAFGGKMGSGKSTAAKYLSDKYGFTIGSFAARLKEIATFACRMQGKDRELLQKLGNEIRKDKPDYWVDVLMSKVEKTNGSFVIDDLRFRNELSKLINDGFLCPYIVRERDLRLEGMGIKHPIEVTEQEQHASETDLDNVNMLYIINNGDMNNFYQQLDDLVLNYDNWFAAQVEMSRRTCQTV